uniref:Uncharacterized protein n=1 Tax=Tanacetum cinerariifolium TaxID=118510 RepID=A0A699TP86_TANCI|nr:hypothetical protein [Tanacetum cinerariifolium]
MGTYWARARLCAPTYFFPRLGRGSRGQLGGGCGVASAEKAAQYLAAQQVAQPPTGAGRAGAFSSDAERVRRDVVRTE